MRVCRLLIGLLVVAPLAAQTGTPPRQALLLELSLPGVGLPPVGAVKQVTVDLTNTSLEKYADKGEPQKAIRKAVRAAQVALWATSPEPAPAPLQAEVLAMRKKMKIDPRTLRLRYNIPKRPQQEIGFKNRVLDTSKKLARVVAYLEEALDELNETAGQRARENPRWQAHHDLVRAWALAPQNYLEELAVAIGTMRYEHPA
jgi:hypothetical protein